MDGKRGFFQSTTALIAALGTLLAGLVALGVFLFGEGVLAPAEQGTTSDRARGPKQDSTVQLTGTFGRVGTSGFEFDGSEIKRNPGSEADVVFFESLGSIASYNGRIYAWDGEASPNRDECAKLLETHGISGDYKLRNDSRFCLRSSDGRTAFLAVVSEGTEFDVYLWK